MNARDEDWEVVIAGQRVQVIKDTEDSKEIYNLVQRSLLLMMDHLQHY